MHRTIHCSFFIDLLLVFVNPSLFVNCVLSLLVIYVVSLLHVVAVVYVASVGYVFTKLQVLGLFHNFGVIECDILMNFSPNYSLYAKV